MLQLEVELENGRKVYLTPKPTDQPRQLATLFCQQHNLDAEMVNVLTRSIQQSLGLSEHSSHPARHNASCRTEPSISPTVSKKGSVVGQQLYDRGVAMEQAHRSWV